VATFRACAVRGRYIPSPPDGIETVMRVLLIAHYFPPDGGAGSQRPASFAQHLPRLGVDLTVVCRSVPDEARRRSDPLDSSLVARTASARVIRTEQAGRSWTDALREGALRAAAEHRPDIVLVTMSPFEHWKTAFVVREKLGIPAVLDLRDPWALDGWFKYGHYFAWRSALSEMRQALSTADGVVMNVPGAAEAARAFVSREGLAPYGVVTNGWEEDDFPEPASCTREARPEWRIRFAGTFLCGFWRRRSIARRLRAALLTSGEKIDERGRSPMFLLAAIRLLRERGEPAGLEAIVELAGRRERETDEIVEASGVGSQVRHLGMLPHDQSVAFVSQADALLLPMHGLPAGARARMVPGKLYEYLATGRPILGLAPAGDARDWIAADPRCRVADPCDAEAIAQALRELHSDWRQERAGSTARHAMAGRFTRRAQAEALVSYLQQVLEVHASGARPIS
jgi:glycosyltransferase involved in cell wall biosynthesis